jgi:ADP-ribosylation factor-like protein 2
VDEKGYWQITMGLLTILKKVKEEEQEIRLLILGLDNAGKTSIVKRYCGQPIEEVEPTLGFSIQTLEYTIHDGEIEAGDSDNKNESNNTTYHLHLWDIGGQSSIRAYWRNYFEQTDGLIWVVDSTDPHRLDLVKQELLSLLQQERLAGATLLVLANKQDLTAATSPTDIATLLELNQRIQYQNRHWAIYGCSAITGDGLEQAMNWLVDDIAGRIF